MRKASGLAAAIVACTSVVVVGMCLYEFSVERMTASSRTTVDGRQNQRVSRSSTTSSGQNVEVVDDTKLALAQGPEATLSPVVLLEYTDYQCSFCGRYARHTYPALRRQYVETRIVEYVVRTFPLEKIHPLALAASEAALCAGVQGKFSEMHRKLFENQNAIDHSLFPAIAIGLGLNEPSFNTCMGSDSTVTAVKRQLEEGIKLGVRGTPTVLLGIRSSPDMITVKRRIAGSQPVELYDAAIMQLLKDHRPSE